jgi:hypothetical protein
VKKVASRRIKKKKQKKIEGKRREEEESKEDEEERDGRMGNMCLEGRESGIRSRGKEQAGN